MAESRDNYVTKGLSGNVGSVGNYFQRNGKTFLRNPRARSNKPDSPKRLLAQERFTRGVKYGLMVKNNPDLTVIYRAKIKKGQSVFNRACQDANISPQIRRFSTSEYNGRQGDSFTVEAKDDFKVASVTITIHNSAGTLIEKGDAVIQQNQLDWLYVTTADNENFRGSIITATAMDLPGNKTMRSRVFV